MRQTCHPSSQTINECSRQVQKLRRNPSLAEQCSPTVEIDETFPAFLIHRRWSCVRPNMSLCWRQCVTVVPARPNPSASNRLRGSERAFNLFSKYAGNRKWISLGPQASISCNLCARNQQTGHGWNQKWKFNFYSEENRRREMGPSTTPAGRRLTRNLLGL